MRTLVNGTLTVQAYNAQVWTQEHNFVKVKETDASAKTVAVLFPNQTTTVAEYTLDENKEAIIDLSDLIRLNPQSHNLYIRSLPNIHTVNANYTPVGLINPVNVLIPNNDTLVKIHEFDEREQDEMGSLLIIPPSRMYMGLDQAGVKFELNYIDDYAEQDYEITADELYGGAWHSLRIDKVISLNPNTTRFVLNEDYIGSNLIDISLRPMECGKRYAAVRWVSFTGQTRVHTWEVTKAKTATRDAIELLTIDGSYHTLKGREDGFVLRLEGLNAYDMWYYADIITSSKVEVSMGGHTWQQVEITTKDVTIPDGDAGKLNTLEINCNWRKYDAITL